MNLFKIIFLFQLILVSKIRPIVTGPPNEACFCVYAKNSVVWSGRRESPPLLGTSCSSLRRLPYVHYIFNPANVRSCSSRRSLRFDSLFSIRTGAGEGNRTLISSLGSWCSATELRPLKALLHQLNRTKFSTHCTGIINL